MNHRIYLSLGSNVAKEVNLPLAVAELKVWGELQAVSAAYETVPVGSSGADDGSTTFLNAAVLLVADLEPDAAKRGMIGSVERKLRRVRDPHDPFAPRTIDIDISLWDDEVMTILGRPVPEPDILQYLHVAQPLADIAPDYVHPLAQRTLADIANELAGAALARGASLPAPRPEVILLP